MNDAENELKELFAQVQANADKQHARTVKLIELAAQLHRHLATAHRYAKAAQGEAVNQHAQTAIEVLLLELEAGLELNA